MSPKIIWPIIVLLAALTVGLVVNYYQSCDKNQARPNNLTPNNQARNEKQFLDFLSEKKQLPQASQEVSMIAVGDISYSRAVERMVKRQNNINYPFLKIRDYLKNADLVFGNLETPITPGAEIPDFAMIFRSNPGTEQALKQAGLSIVSLANNHTPNFGEKGLNNTFNYLNAVGIKYVGAGLNDQEAYQPIYLDQQEIKLAFLAYNDTDVVPNHYEASANRAGTAFMRIDKLSEAVQAAKQNADLVIVSMHSGVEYVEKPNNSQINFAHAAIDAGADLVIGHHPHVVQTLEKYKGKFIFYSLGNFIFDQPQSAETKEGLAIKIYFTKNGLSKISLLPVVMKNLAQPEAADKDKAAKILQRLDFPLANQDVYTWNQHNFEKTVRKIIYNDAFNNNKIITKQERADLDNNSVSENYNLANGQLTITENEKTIWQSPSDWWIDNFVLADSNNDGITEINLSLWKSGSFGASKPFWIEENDVSVKNHFFVLGFSDGSIKQLWGSSNLPEPNCEFKIADVDNDGKNDLVVLEGDYGQKPQCIGNYLAVWKWNGWGFTNEWRSAKGNFANLDIENHDGKNYIIVDTP